MAKKNRNFDLGKDSGRDFNLGKGGKRKFDLRKDSDDAFIDVDNVEPVVDPLIEAPEPQPVEDYGNDDQPKNRRTAWTWAIWIIAALLCIFFLWLIPWGDKNPEDTAVVMVDGEAPDPEAQADEGENTVAPEGVQTPEGMAVENPAVTTPDAGNVPTNTQNMPAPEAATPAAPANNTVAAPAAPANTAEATAAPAKPKAKKAKSKPAKAKAPAVETPATDAAVEVAEADVPSGAVSSDIESEAIKVIRGDYGNNPGRKNNLGDKYEDVQKRVNELKRQGKF